MARARNIKPGFFTNEALVELPMATRLLFIGLWTLADREGRLEDRPKKIKMELFPADEIDVDEALSTLVSSTFIQRYRVDEVGYIQVNTFSKHQRPHSNESASIIPPPSTPGKRAGTQNAHDSGENDDAAHHGEQGGAPWTEALRPDSLNTDSLIPEEVPDGTRRPAADVAELPSAKEDPPRPRSARQRASDADHERRLALYEAWCRGIGLNPASGEAVVGRDVAFSQLKQIVRESTPSPSDFEACTRFLASEDWRSTPPAIPDVLRRYAPWVSAGRPTVAQPRSRSTSSRASPPDRRIVPREELDRRIAEAEAREANAR